MPALVLLDVRVAVLDRRQRGVQIGGDAVLDVPEVEVVRRAHEDRRRVRDVLRPVDVGREVDPVAHRHHHLAVDDGEPLELVLDRPALIFLLLRETGRLLRAADGDRGD